ncbi:MAG: hypothetical protein RLY78_1755 [Pseudomonadota bacterium]
MVAPHTPPRLPPGLGAAISRMARSLHGSALRCRDRLCLGTGDELSAEVRERLLAAQALLARRVGVLSHDFEAALLADCARLLALRPGGVADSRCPSPDELISRWEQLAGVSADELALHSAAARLADELAVACAHPLRALQDRMGQLWPQWPATLRTQLLQPEQLTQALTQALEALCDEPELRLLLCEELGRSWGPALGETCLALAAHWPQPQDGGTAPTPSGIPSQTPDSSPDGAPASARTAAWPAPDDRDASLEQLLEQTPARVGAPAAIGRLMRTLWLPLIQRAEAGDPPALPALPDGGAAPLTGTPAASALCRAWALELLLSTLPAVAAWPRPGLAQRLPALMKALQLALDHLDWPPARREAWLAELLTLHAVVLRQRPGLPEPRSLGHCHAALTRLAGALGCSLPPTWHPEPQDLPWSHWLDLARDRTRRQLAELAQGPATRLSPPVPDR